VEDAIAAGGALLLEAADLDRLHAALQGAGYRVIVTTLAGSSFTLSCPNPGAELMGGSTAGCRPGPLRPAGRGGRRR
jgi:hypothetical protein